MGVDKVLQVAIAQPPLLTTLLPSPFTTLLPLILLPLHILPALIELPYTLDCPLNGCAKASWEGEGNCDMVMVCGGLDSV